MSAYQQLELYTEEPKNVNVRCFLSRQIHTSIHLDLPFTNRRRGVYHCTPGNARDKNCLFVGAKPTYPQKTHQQCISTFN